MIRQAPTEVQWPEVAAYNRVILHAHRFSAEELEEHARSDVKFADLFLDVRTAYKLKLVKFEGRLISLRQMESNDELRAAGVETRVRGVAGPGQRAARQPGVHRVHRTAGRRRSSPNGRVNKWVSFAGYYFKKMRYESAEQDPKNPGQEPAQVRPAADRQEPDSAARPGRTDVRDVERVRAGGDYRRGGSDRRAPAH